LNNKLTMLPVSTPSITVDSTANSGVKSSVSSFTMTCTVGSGLANSVLAVANQARGASVDSDLTITSVKDGSTNFTNATSTLGADTPTTGSLRTELWYLLNPSIGSRTITITFTGTVNYATAYCVSLSGVNQITPVDATAGTGDAASAHTSPVTQNITTAADNSWIIDSIYHKIGTTLTPGSGQTRISTELFPNGGGDTSDASYKGPITPAGSTSTSWTYSGADGYTISSASFKPATGTTRVCT
jgi:hypothetical protein